MTEATYDLDYALMRLRDAIDYAEKTGEVSAFNEARKWVNEVEAAAKDNEPKEENGTCTCGLSPSGHRSLEVLTLHHYQHIHNGFIKGCNVCAYLERESLIDPDTKLVDPSPSEESAEGSP